jgi:hypothetical protein
MKCKHRSEKLSSAQWRQITPAEDRDGGASHPAAPNTFPQYFAETPIPSEDRLGQRTGTKQTKRSLYD